MKTLLNNIKQYREELKEVNMLKKDILKSYLIAIIFSVILMLLPVIFLVNLLILWQYILYVQIGLLLCYLGLVYLIFTFKDQAMCIYYPEYKNYHYKAIKNFDFIFLTVPIIIIFIIYVLFFKWW